LAQQAPGTKEMGFHGIHRQLEDFGNLLVTQMLQVIEHHNTTIFRRQFTGCRFNESFEFSRLVETGRGVAGRQVTQFVGSIAPGRWMAL